MNYDQFFKDKKLKFPKDSHSIFAASNYHWLNYDIEKMLDIYAKKVTAREIGTKMHNLAAMLIELRQPLPDVESTLNMYVNDAISFGMTPEKQLYFSEEFRGTADAITVDSENVLRVHDFKSGVIRASLKQLRIYAALFCLDFGCRPDDFKDINLRIYQNNDIVEESVGVNEIVPIMDKMITVDKIIRKVRMSNGGVIS